METLRISFFLVLLPLLWSCKAEWQQTEKDKIKADCLLAAEKYGFSNPEVHCDCVLRKIINRYPNPNDFENMEMGEFGQIVNECQGQELSTRIIWPDNVQKAFVDSCTSMARSAGQAKPEQYCRCVLDELILRYPTNDSLSKILPKALPEISKVCKKKVE